MENYDDKVFYSAAVLVFLDLLEKGEREKLKEKIDKSIAHIWTGWKDIQRIEVTMQKPHVYPDTERIGMLITAFLKEEPTYTLGVGYFERRWRTLNDA